MNLRTNVKVKVKVYKGKELLKIKRFTIRFSDMRKRFLFVRVKDYLEKIKFTKDIKCDITVYYTRTKGDENSGVYTNTKELLHAFYCFTEQSLVKEFWDKVLIPKRVLSVSQQETLKRMGIKKWHNMAPHK